MFFNTILITTKSNRYPMILFLGFGYAQVAFWAVLSLVSILDTGEEALISLVIPYLRCEWNLTLFFEGTITVSVFLFYGIS